MPLNPDEVMGLRRIRRLQRAYWILFLAIPVLLLVLMPVVQITGQWPLLILLLVPFISGIVVQQKLLKVKCPHCHKPFFQPAPIPIHATSIPSQKKCQHCQLSLKGPTP